MSGRLKINAFLTLVLGEGGGPPQARRFVLVAAIFISLECAGVLLGYALLAKPMGLFRKVSVEQSL